MPLRKYAIESFYRQYFRNCSAARPNGFKWVRYFFIDCFVIKRGGAGQSPGGPCTYNGCREERKETDELYIYAAVRRRDLLYRMDK